MTYFKSAVQACRAIGVRLTRKDGEYRVNYINGKEATAYYTTDLQDAVDTAEAMVRQEQSEGARGVEC